MASSWSTAHELALPNRFITMPMTPRTIISRSVGFYWRTHLGVILGTALAAMVLVGSLLVGDSVKATLKHQALARVGQVESILTAGDRYFRSDLGHDVGAETASALMLRGSVVRADGTARINQTQVLGVDERFWSFAPKAAAPLAGEDLALNERAAAQLGVKAGDTVVLRLEKPGLFSRDAPLSGDESEVVAIRTKVQRVVSDAEFGRFGLAASQVPPFNVFIPLDYLQKRLEFAGKANVLLSRQPANTLATAVRAKWNLTDAALELRPLPNDRGRELRSSRVFIDDSIVASVPKGLDALTYLVNELRFGAKAAPYSMVTAVDAPSSGFLPAELADNEIAITQWLADDLGIKLNEKLALKYFVMGERRQLVEKSREFEVIQILPMNEPSLDREWMPDFPGLSDKENCRDWKPGFAIDNSKIRDQDEAYWKQYRGTPKAFVNLHIGQEMWGNRWGKITSIRYPATKLPNALSSDIRAGLSLEQLGFTFTALRQQALAATDAPVDFGELFVSFSFFLIVAAAVLTGLLFVFTLEQRAVEAGTLLAIGLPPKLVRRMLLGEGVALAVIGTIIGCVGALLYTQLVLRGLATVWRGAVGTSEFAFAASPVSLIGGGIGSIVTAFIAMWWASRRLLRCTTTQLLGGDITPAPHADARQRRLGMPIAIGLGVLAVATALASGGSPELFFGAGALLLGAGLTLGGVWLRNTTQPHENRFTFGALAASNAARRRGRSLATIAVLASGVFMVVAVDSFRQRPVDEKPRRGSGTGGFALVGEAAAPVYEDLNSESAWETYAIVDTAMKDVHVVPVRVREGDDASCLNLNRALQPRLLAVKPPELQDRFIFGKKDTGWEVLDAVESDGALPGIVDANTLQWALQKKLGDTIEYRDERGQPFKVRLAATLTGSMLQGNVIIAERDFIEKFPGSGGYRFFFIDCPPERTGAVAEELGRALQDRGLELTPAARRLAEFQAVENTYLSIFQALGGLGLLLGTAGLAIVVARNVLERRREFGLLEAVGFRPEQLRSLVFREHRWLIVLGLVIGTASALLGVWPQLAQKTGGFPWREMGLLLLGLVVGCVFWTWLAARAALRGSQLPALRNE